MMKIEKMYVATQEGALGNKLVAYGHERNKVITDLHRQLLSEMANAYAHEQAMTHLSMELDVYTNNYEVDQL